MFIIKIETRGTDAYYNADNKKRTVKPNTAKQYTSRDKAKLDVDEAESDGGFAVIVNYEKELKKYLVG